MNVAESSSLDLVWGVAEIAKVIGRTERQTYHMISSGLLPVVKQVGQRYVASRQKLLSFFLEGEDAVPSVQALRSKAKKLGYRFRRSNWRKDSIDNHGGYQIVDVNKNCVVGGCRYELDLSDVAAFLEDQEVAA